MKDTLQVCTTDFTNLIGIPYDKANCWELARLFYAQVFQIELKHYFNELPKDRTETMNLIYSNIGEFYPQSKPEFGSLLLIKIRAVESHIGIYVGNNRFLHTTKTTGSVIDRTERFKETITGAWGVR